MWLLALLIGCGCTEAGCLSTLSLRIEGVADAETVEVVVTGVPGGARCTWDASGVGVVAGGEVVLESTAEPEWSPYYPNGKRCGGACHGAEVELSVP